MYSSKINGYHQSNYVYLFLYSSMSGKRIQKWKQECNTIHIVSFLFLFINANDILLISKGNHVRYRILEAHIQIKIHLYKNRSNNKCVIIIKLGRCIHTVSLARSSGSSRPIDCLYKSRSQHRNRGANRCLNPSTHCNMIFLAVENQNSP